MKKKSKRVMAKVVKVSRPKFRPITEDEVEVDWGPMKLCPSSSVITHLIRQDKMEEYLQKELDMAYKFYFDNNPSTGDKNYCSGMIAVLEKIAFEFSLEIKRK